MPYYYDGIEEPVSDDDWEKIEEIWHLIRHEMLRFHFETQDDAIKERNRFHKDVDEDRFSNWMLVPFRKTNDHEQLAWYHELGLEALAHTENCIKRRQFGAKFAYQWGMLTACHAYILSAALATGTDLTREIGGVRTREKLNRDAQRQWFAHYYFRPELEKLERNQRTDRIGALVNWIIDNRPDLDADWFERMLNVSGTPSTNEYYGQISGAFRDKKLSVKHMRALIDLPTNNLPPLDLSFPTP